MQRHAQKPAVVVGVDVGAQVRVERRSRIGQAVEDLDLAASFRYEDAAVG